MSVDGRIKVATEHRGQIQLILAPYQQGDGQMSIVGTVILRVLPPIFRRPVVGQRIWGSSGHCMVEPGHGGPRIEYSRYGMDLYEIGYQIRILPKEEGDYPLWWHHRFAGQLFTVIGFRPGRPAHYTVDTRHLNWQMGNYAFVIASKAAVVTSRWLSQRRENGE